MSSASDRMFVERLRSLPERERTIWLAIFVHGTEPEQLASLVGVDGDKLDEMMVEVEKRLFLNGDDKSTEQAAIDAMEAYAAGMESGKLLWIIAALVSFAPAGTGPFTQAVLDAADFLERIGFKPSSNDIREKFARGSIH